MNEPQGPGANHPHSGAKMNRSGPGTMQETKTDAVDKAVYVMPPTQQLLEKIDTFFDSCRSGEFVPKLWPTRSNPTVDYVASFTRGGKSMFSRMSTWRRNSRDFRGYRWRRNLELIASLPDDALMKLNREDKFDPARYVYIVLFLEAVSELFNFVDLDLLQTTMEEIMCTSTATKGLMKALRTPTVKLLQEAANKLRPLATTANPGVTKIVQNIDSASASPEGLETLSQTYASATDDHKKLMRAMTSVQANETQAAENELDIVIPTITKPPAAEDELNASAHNQPCDIGFIDGAMAAARYVREGVKDLALLPKGKESTAFLTSSRHGDDHHDRLAILAILETLANKWHNARKGYVIKAKHVGAEIWTHNVLLYVHGDITRGSRSIFGATTPMHEVQSSFDRISGNPDKEACDKDLDAFYNKYGARR
jgi:hypothetical protein